MIKYKVTFNDYQMSIFNALDFNGNKRHNLMSVYSYLIKHSIDNLVSKSLSKLYSMYIRHHKKIDSTIESISKAYFCKLVKDLVDLELLERDNRKVFILETRVDKKVDEKVDKKNPTESVENSILDEIFANAEIPNSNSSNNTYNLYYTSDEDVFGMNYNLDFDSNSETEFGSFIPNNDVIATKEELLDITEELFKQFRIKSKIVKSEVRDRIEKYASKIYRKTAVDYIAKVIGDMHGKNEARRNAFLQSSFERELNNKNNMVEGVYDFSSKAKNKNFLEMMQRDRSEGNEEGSMTWDEIEQRLLGLK